MRDESTWTGQCSLESLSWSWFVRFSLLSSLLTIGSPSLIIRATHPPTRKWFAALRLHFPPISKTARARSLAFWQASAGSRVVF